MHLVSDFILKKTQGKFDFLLRWKVGNDRWPEKTYQGFEKFFIKLVENKWTLNQSSKQLQVFSN